jgi:hypothetical protein
MDGHTVDTDSVLTFLRGERVGAAWAPISVRALSENPWDLQRAAQSLSQSPDAAVNAKPQGNRVEPREARLRQILAPVIER